MSKYPRLPSLISRYIEEEWIKTTSSISVIHDPSLPNKYDQSKLISPFKCVLFGREIWDGFYTIPANVLIPLEDGSEIIVNDWSLSYENGIVVDIKQAEVLSSYGTIVKVCEVLIENNFLVCETLRKFKFSKIKKEIKEVINENDEKSQRFLKNIEIMNEEIEREDRIIRDNSNLDSLVEIINIEKPLKKIDISFDIGIKEFPQYALEYLKNKYNIV